MVVEADIVWSTNDIGLERSWLYFVCQISSVLATIRTMKAMMCHDKAIASKKDDGGSDEADRIPMFLTPAANDEAKALRRLPRRNQ